MHSQILLILCELNERKDALGSAASSNLCGMGQRRQGCVGHFREEGIRCSGSCDRHIVRPNSSEGLTSTRGICWYPNPMTYRSRRWWWTLMRRNVTVLGPAFVIVHTLIWISMVHVWLMRVLQGYGVSFERNLESDAWR